MQLFSEKDHGMKAYPDRHLFAFKCWFYDVVLVVQKSDFYLIGLRRSSYVLLTQAKTMSIAAGITRLRCKAC